MPPSRPLRSTAKLPPPAGNDVDAFLEALEHPLRDDVVRVRRWVLDAAPGVSEAVKWNAPSFRVGNDFFATFHLRSTTEVQLVFHTGAKKRAQPKAIVLTPAAARLVEWLSEDRALVALAPGRLSNLKAPFTTLVREWVRQLDATTAPTVPLKPKA
ncbi:MAG: DUF1801 domain-containing protein [Myxococcaceae bacterium]|jgi:hypothetical protein|nr:DUF1801 domain-containing protein [Myxococcaceae bacterium]